MQIMKSLRYAILAFVGFALVGCDPAKDDEFIIEEFDHTAPAYVMFAQSMKGICAASGSLVGALNFNEWLNAAADTEEQWEVEDKYYPYSKIREREENLWDIYDSAHSELYFLREGKTLSEEGAVWEARQHPKFWVQQEHHTPLISRIAEDCFEVAFGGESIDAGFYPYYSLYENLHSWRYYYDDLAKLTTTLSVATNNTEFRTSELSHLLFTITGSGSLRDHYEGYEVTFEITEPLQLGFMDNGLFATNVAGAGSMRVSNSLGEWADVTMTPYNAIVIDFHPKDSTPVRGYYNWNGESITPR